MVKNGEKHTEIKAVKKVLITQPKPEGEKSPYFDLAKKYSIELHFHPFIIVEGIPAKDFRDWPDRRPRVRILRHSRPPGRTLTRLRTRRYSWPI